MIQQGARLLGLDLSEQQQQQIVDYIALLIKWNKAYNLTAITAQDKIITHHILDCLAVVPWIQHQSMIDIGTGAGLPGILMAIARPDIRLTLLDSNGKKTRFLTQVVYELGLTTVEVQHARIQDYLPEQRFAGVITRALAKWEEIVAYSQHLLLPDGMIYAMKGPGVYQEIPKSTAVSIHRLTVPGMSDERYLVSCLLEDAIECPHPDT